MVKIAHNVSSLGYLRDIRIAVTKPRRSGSGPDGNPTTQSVLQAAEEALQTREEAGYERGKRDAQEQHSRQIEQMRQEWETAHRAEIVRLLEKLNGNVNQQISETFKALEKHLILLAAEAAIKLTSGIPISADRVEACVREALNLVEQDTEITVFVNPQDLALLEEQQSALLNGSGANPGLKFRSDEKITRGGCLLTSKFGELDARLETKIELLKKAVNE
jgi:flagellar assembly protein FliH